MNLKKLGCLLTAFGRTNKNVLFPRLSTHQTAAACIRYKSEKSTTKTDDDDDDLDKPIEFSNSAAAKWNPVYSRVGAEIDDRPWYQTYVIVASVSVFLIYFCVLREENDVDKKLVLQLSDHFPNERREDLKMSQAVPAEYVQIAKFK